MQIMMKVTGGEFDTIDYVLRDISRNEVWHWLNVDARVSELFKTFESSPSAELGEPFYVAFHLDGGLALGVEDVPWGALPAGFKKDLDRCQWALVPGTLEVDPDKGQRFSVPTLRFYGDGTAGYAFYAGSSGQTQYCSPIILGRLFEAVETMQRV